MKKSRIILSCLLVFCFLFFIIVVISLIVGLKNTEVGKKWGKDKIGILRIEGVIIGGRSKPTLFSSNFVGAETVIENLKKMRENPSIKAIVLRINSPGGSAAASQEIYQEIKNCKSEGKKIIVSMSDVCASGAYYISSCADVIVANPATLTGSIGVIMELENIKELFDKIGIGFEVIKSGEYKDIGSPLRKISKKEKRLLQNLIDDIYNQFVRDVSLGRKLSIKDVKKIADGRVFTGEQALKFKLVDKIGNFSYAIKIAAELAKIKGEPETLEYKSRNFDFFWGESKGKFLSYISKFLCMDETLIKNMKEMLVSGER